MLDSEEKTRMLRSWDVGSLQREILDLNMFLVLSVGNGRNMGFVR